MFVRAVFFSLSLFLSLSPHGVMADSVAPGAVLSAAFQGTQARGPLQAWIDAAPAGSTLKLPAGRYTGPARINKPLTLDGQGQVTVDGGAVGHVLLLQGQHIVIKNLHLAHSGRLHDRLDAAVWVEGSDIDVGHNRIDDALFGVVAHNSQRVKIHHNRIASLPERDSRGDAVRLWNSHYILVSDNHISDSRDLIIANSSHHRIINNHVERGRRALSLTFARRVLISGNRFSHNDSGVTALNSDGLTIRNNRIQHAIAAAGAAIALKESAAALISDNQLLHCAHGIMADSPLHPINRMSIIGNRFAHNITAIYFYGVRGGHIIGNNHFDNNLGNVSIVGDGDIESDYWHGNEWDDYQGFDLNADGVGDFPHEYYVWADRLWLENPAAIFWRNSPLLELLDFLERLAPFISPSLVLKDNAPAMPVR